MWNYVQKGIYKHKNKELWKLKVKGLYCSDNNKEAILQKYDEWKLKRDKNTNSRKYTNLQRELYVNTLVNKRAKDVSISGDTSSMERRIIHRRKHELEKYGLDICILNDGTRADVLVRIDKNIDLWLPIQWKTTARCVIDKRRKNSAAYSFYDLSGYDDMIIICECEADRFTWVYAGYVLDGLKCKKIAKSTANNECYIGNDSSSFILASTLKKLIVRNEYVMVLKNSARQDFKNSSGKNTHKIEYSAITAWRDVHMSTNIYRKNYGYKELTKNEINDINTTFSAEDNYNVLKTGTVFRWPDLQQSVYDCEICFDAHRKLPKWYKVQVKTVFKRSSFGYKTGLSTACGTDYNKKQICRPYSIGDADIYVFILPYESKYGIYNELHVWECKEGVLFEKNIISDQKIKGKTTLTVHMDQKYTSENPNSIKNNSLWTRKLHTKHHIVNVESPI